MSTSRDGRFALQQLTSIEWIVVDTALDANDPHRTLACVYEADQFEYDVLWLRDLALPTKYMCPTDVLDDISRAMRRGSRVPSRKPIPIPHRAPAAAFA
ncbi:hypothetical protein LK09_09685 [Microbacterium mangrovi]|uniref:Uncharacterized protein n=1 Tax=Microbacterium mangrovi TaxID=1348253 RepID=A0A0B2A312_9MICO|nr:hypothetical protein LK09_09685 [Microbacterium mangrovi]